MKKLLLFLACAAGLVLSTQPVAAKKPQLVVNSEPSGAAIYINGANTGLQTPATLPIKGNKPFTLTIQKKGYEDGQVVVAKTNMLGKNQFPPQVSCTLTPLVTAPTAYQKDPTIRRGEAQKMVSRDAAGQTALEQTIIRWAVDSDPQGARVFWRVISSVPDQVKNTNESYLMTTPYEETRSFNILGLTYENLRDVQIEIKLSLPGYNDQVKRFNVRQAIDQQEISAFYQMVPKAGNSTTAAQQTTPQQQQQPTVQIQVQQTQTGASAQNSTPAQPAPAQTPAQQ